MKTNFRSLKSLKLWLPVIVLFFAMLACGPNMQKFWAGSIVRDVDTTGRELHLIYQNEGNGIESQIIQFFIKGGTWRQAQITYGKAAQQATESLWVKNSAGALEERCVQEQSESNERVLDITKSKLTYSTCNDGVNYYQITKNEIKFLLPGLLPEQENFKLESYYQVPVGENGRPQIESADEWYLAIYGDTLLGDTYRPNYAIIENSPFSAFHANWAGENEGFDGAMSLTKDMFVSLNENGWTSISPEYGNLRLSVYNPFGLKNLLGFRSEVHGFAVTENGAVVEYRIRPEYVVLDPNLYYGYAKANSPAFGTALQSLLWEIKVPGSSDQWVTVAGAHFLKGRFASNGLYAFKRYLPGETVAGTIESIRAELDRGIPQDFDQYFEKGYEFDASDAAAVAKKQEIEESIRNWVYSRKPFNLQDVKEKLNLEVVAVVNYADIGDYIEEWYGCGTSETPRTCSRTVQTTPRTQLVWDIAALTPENVDFMNHLFVFMGEPAMEAYALDYVQKGQGDGAGIMFAALSILNHISDGTLGYLDAIRLDQRSPAAPEMIDSAMADIFGAWTEYWQGGEIPFDMPIPDPETIEPTPTVEPTSVP